MARVLAWGMPYEHLDRGGDAGVRAEGATTALAFRDAALGMYALIAPPGKVAPRVEKAVRLGRQGREELLVGWLNELVYIFDAEGFIGCEVDIDEMTDTSIAARVRGEEYDPARHGGGVLVKAATYHGLAFGDLPGGGLRVEILFDI